MNVRYHRRNVVTSGQLSPLGLLIVPYHRGNPITEIDQHGVVMLVHGPGLVRWPVEFLQGSVFVRYQIKGGCRSGGIIYLILLKVI